MSSSRSRWRRRWRTAKRIVAAAAAARGFLMVGHICRFNPRYAAAKREIEVGRIGRIVALSSRRNIPAAWTPEILNKIGPIIGDAIHDTDLMLWFTGAKVVSAYAQTVDVRGLKYPDIGQTMYRFDSGATATLETVWCMPEKTPFDIDERMSIIGTEGFIHIQDTFPNIGICTEDGFRSPDTTYWPELHGASTGALREEFLYFARCIQGGTPPHHHHARGIDGSGKNHACRRTRRRHRRGRPPGVGTGHPETTRRGDGRMGKRKTPPTSPRPSPPPGAERENRRLGASARALEGNAKKSERPALEGKKKKKNT